MANSVNVQSHGANFKFKMTQMIFFCFAEPGFFFSNQRYKQNQSVKKNLLYRTLNGSLIHCFLNFIAIHKTNV